jgi:hypothetical protein
MKTVTCMHCDGKGTQPEPRYVLQPDGKAYKLIYVDVRCSVCLGAKVITIPDKESEKR